MKLPKEKGQNIKRDKQCSTKHYTENQRLSSTNTSKTSG
jgi:hypothetical protein